MPDYERTGDQLPILFFLSEATPVAVTAELVLLQLFLLAQAIHAKPTGDA